MNDSFFPIGLRDDVELCELEPSHSSSLFRIFDTDRERFERWVPYVREIRTLSEAEEYVAGRIRDNSRGCCYAALCIQGDLQGIVGIFHIDPELRSGAISYWVSSAAEGKGLVTSALRKMISHGFLNMDLVRLTLCAEDENSRSWAIAERLGFDFEQMIVEKDPDSGEFHDSRVYAVTADDWRNIAESNSVIRADGGALPLTPRLRRDRPTIQRG